MHQANIEGLLWTAMLDQRKFGQNTITYFSLNKITEIRSSRS